MNLLVTLASVIVLVVGASGKHIVRLSAHDIADIERRFDIENTVEERESAKRVRDGVKDTLMRMQLPEGQQHSHAKRAAAEEDAEETLQLIQEAKRAVHRSMGLSEKVEPRNDGLWQGDILLRKEDAEKYILEYGGILSEKSRKRRSVYSPDLSNGVRRWSSPISFYCDSTISSAACQFVQIALNQVTQQIPCLVFKQVTSQPSSGPYLQYTFATGMGGCGGYAYIGMQSQVNNAANPSINPVSIDLTATFCGQWKSGPLTNTSANLIVTHETFHALGLSHEQQRGDMANFIGINQANVQTNQWNNFVQDSNNTFTTYGQTYNYYSMMQYGSTTFAVSTAINTMNALIQPIAQNTAAMGHPGGNIANISDIIILNNTYCRNPSSGYTPQIVNITTQAGAWTGTTAIAGAACLTQASATPATPASCPSGYSQTNYMPVECVICNPSCVTSQAGDDWAAQAFRMSTPTNGNFGSSHMMSISVRQCTSNTPVCADQYALCGYWAQSGYCSQSANATACPKSCNTATCSQYYGSGSG